MNSTSGWWTEIWSVGRGSDRVYCGIARTEDGFAVDLFCGDTCIESRVVETRADAVKTAGALERRHSRGGHSRQVPRRPAAEALSW
jgi:hypothetical protein